MRRFKSMWVLCSVTLFALLLGANTALGIEKVKFTDKFVDFYGYGDMFKKDDVLTVYDPDGVLCGEFRISEDGQYGIIHVYGDDRTSSGTDEGAQTGDPLYFYLNGEEIIPKDSEKAVWSSDGASVQMDF